MYLNNYQQELVRCLNEKGSEGIHEMIYDYITSNNISFEKILSFSTSSINYPQLYRMKFYAWDIEAFVNIPRVEDIFNPYKDPSEQEMIPDPEQYEKLKNEEIRLKRPFIHDLQQKIESALNLIKKLTEEDLVISYSENFQVGHVVGYTDWNKNTEIISYEINESDFGNKNRLYGCLDSFFSLRLILLPGLAEFEKNEFQTIQEIDRRSELLHLKKQTKYVLFGILFSAFVTLIPTFQECYWSTHGESEETDIINVFEPKTDDNTNPPSED
nr:hypothetical protein [uncultured Sphaerochaeta sp.]